MSHGGFGGGGGHGHSGFGGHGHHSSILGHSGGGGGGHHGTVVGHVLRALGIGQHGHHVHGIHGAGHHPDQAPNWNQAMQAEKGGWKKALLRIDRRPFIMLFLLFFSSFTWLYIVYKLHHNDVVRERAEADVPIAARSSPMGTDGSMPAGSAAPAYAIGAAGLPGYTMTAQYPGIATTAGAANPSLATEYGAPSTSAYNAISAPYGTAAGSQYPAFGTAAVSQYGNFGAPRAGGAAPGYPSAGGLQPGYELSGSAPRTGYAPAADGRQRLVVSR